MILSIASLIICIEAKDIITANTIIPIGSNLVLPTNNIMQKNDLTGPYKINDTHFWNIYITIPKIKIKKFKSELKLLN